MQIYEQTLINIDNELLKEYRIVFRAGLRDPYTRDVVRLSESVKMLEPQASVLLRFPKVEQHPQVHESRYPAWTTIW